MANPNIRQKIAVIPNNAALKTTIEDYLILGYVVHQMINLAPVSNYIMIVYYDPAVDPVLPI
jgi:hypothetical protein